MPSYDLTDRPKESPFSLMHLLKSARSSSDFRSLYKESRGHIPCWHKYVLLKLLHAIIQFGTLISRMKAISQ